MASTLEMQPSPYSSMKQDDSEFNITEWGVKSRIISRENTKSRRYSASIIRSIREDSKSFRSNITISSTASSPGYTLKDEIDPSTYSFTTALKALQARSVYKSWECLSPDGFALNSKWNEAEKYICNPLSGEVPMECLSAKTLSGRLFQNSTTNKITMSAPLVFSSRQIQTKAMASTYSFTKEDVALQFHSPEKKNDGMTRDACTQSGTLPSISSSNPSTNLTPSIVEISTNEDSQNSDDNQTKSEEEVELKDKETWETIEETLKEKKDEQLCRQGGCFSWIRKKKMKGKENQRRNNIIFLINNVC
ncbi:hypothetical protein MtrunA17_Chr6g0457141 [Medicago truncatula]|uniref:LuxR family transcriptional regulator, putative n=1 Tax=Medicago truncatula TaxID=3880 RepID=A0A072U6F4_MEDTR|nr:uncharacterized protein LOC25495609 [Medicago truncatula]KEH25329.1 LuxR family transcriptional regulator, putative [Medicago truncatula]RHN50413.1 hypothetical protein MtrunA17_Chr6g0457141 [Medicago truncatula]